MPFLLAKLNTLSIQQLPMKFYDFNLKELPHVYNVEWFNLPKHDTFGIYSQLISLFLNIDCSKKCCIVTTSEISQINNTQWINKINSSFIDLLVINISDHPIDLNYDFLKIKLNKECIVLGANFCKSNYFPFWMIASHDWAQVDKVDLETKKKFFAAMVMGKPRIPRVYLHDILMHKHYYCQLDITVAPYQFLFNNSLSCSEKLNHIVTTIHAGDQLKIPNIELVYNAFFLKIPELNTRNINFNGYFAPVADISNGMDLSYLQIVCESRPEIEGFISEKIFKPIRNGQLFVVQGSMGTVAYLRSIGFDTFDDYIDHNRYDRELDWIKRTHLMVSALDDIIDNTQQIYVDTYKRRLANRERLLDQNLKNQIIKDLANRISDR